MNSLNLNWEKYTEEQIHTIVCMLFNSLEYHIKNLHKADRANENGADIIVEKGDEKIAIAVKIKPTKKDMSQLMEFVQRKKKKKIYLYIKTPTDKFQKFMKPI